MSERERFPYLNAKNLRQKSQRILTGGIILAAAGFGSFIASDIKVQNPEAIVPVVIAEAGAIASGAVLIVKSKELRDAADIQEDHNERRRMLKEFKAQENTAKE